MLICAVQVLKYCMDGFPESLLRVQGWECQFNGGVNAKMGVFEVYSNDSRHLAKVDFLKLFFG